MIGFKIVSYCGSRICFAFMPVDQSVRINLAGNTVIYGIVLELALLLSNEVAEGGTSVD